jgi:GNAT superfamily N-acetyltransferase
MGDLKFRDASASDLPAIIAMLADDPLGRTREDAALPLAQSYYDAFAAVDAAPNQWLVVAERDGLVVATLQLLLIPGISKRGSWRGQIEAVRVARELRGGGIGRQLVLWALELCRTRGCASVQLTSHISRSDAHRFWESLGFEATHRGYKADLSASTGMD